jgi:hypothetical protein
VFQDSWATKFLKAEFIMGEDYLFSQMKCMVCLIAEGKENLLSPKLDILHKHVGWKKTIVTSLDVVIED